MQVNQYYSNDYAGLVSGRYKFYYGYEVTNDKDEWCFQVKENGIEVFNISEKEIEKNIDSHQLDMPQDFLLAGIGMWLLLK